MKTGNIYFMQVPRDVWNYELSNKALVLYFWLNELEQRYTNKKTTYFFRSDEDLANDLHWNIKTVKEAKSELKKTDLISCGYVNWWMDEEHTKKSKRRVTSYRLK